MERAEVHADTLGRSQIHVCLYGFRRIHVNGPHEPAGSLDGRGVDLKAARMGRHWGDEIGEVRKRLIRNGLVERATGIEPVSEAWEASVLPLY